MIYKLKSALKSYIWGGTNLKTEWNKVSDEPTIAESWELSFHPVGPCTIVGGADDGNYRRKKRPFGAGTPRRRVCARPRRAVRQDGNVAHTCRRARCKTVPGT